MSISADDRFGNLGRRPLVARLSGGLRLLRATSAGPIVGLIVLIVILAFLSLYPLSMLLYGSLHSTPPGMAGTFNLAGYQDVLSQQSLLALLNTIGLALAKTIPSLVIAVLLAWILARTDTPLRGTLEVLVTLPFFVPPILTAMAWGMLGNPRRPAQSAVSVGDGLGRRADQCLFLRRRGLAHDAIFHAVSLSPDRRRFSRHGP